MVDLLFDFYFFIFTVITTAYCNLFISAIGLGLIVPANGFHGQRQRKHKIVSTSEA